MNDTTFSKANGLYEAGDYATALRRYNDCLTDTLNKLQPGEIGKVYHQIGNCLMKMNKPADAVRAYNKAENDAAYAETGSLLTNIGKAYSSLKDYDKAKESFKRALALPNYEHRYKAYMGLGNVQVKTGDSADAGRSFREAALDKNNPDPAKALLNLGVCFMSLGRPQDALATYESAKAFDTSTKTKNSILASMGQAYAASDDPKHAVECFEKATADETFHLSDSASVDFSRCVTEISRAAKVQEQADLSGLDVSTVEEMQQAANDPYFYDDAEAAALDYVQGYIDAYTGNDDRFFTATEEELKEIYKNSNKRGKRKKSFVKKLILVLIGIILVAGASGCFAYSQGYGYPTQEMVAQQAFANPDANSDVFASSATDTAKQQMASTLVKDSNVSITGMQRSASTSKVYVTATTSDGGEVNYCLTMAREAVGWKITNVELYFASQNS